MLTLLGEATWVEINHYCFGLSTLFVVDYLLPFMLWNRKSGELRFSFTLFTVTALKRFSMHSISAKHCSFPTKAETFASITKSHPRNQRIKSDSEHSGNWQFTIIQYKAILTSELDSKNFQHKSCGTGYIVFIP